MIDEKFHEKIASTSMITSNDPKSFAYKSMGNRIPQILNDVIEKNKGSLNDEQLRKLNKLYQDMTTNQKINKLDEHSKGEDTKKWIKVWEEWLNQTWLQAPWYYAESYCFRLILEYTGYYDSLRDPFLVMKDNELKSDCAWKLLKTALDSQNDLDTNQSLSQMLKFCLWGNKADGCFRTANSETRLTFNDEFILVDDTKKVISYLESIGSDSTVCFINDNCGTELLMDLCLADYLLQHKYCKKVTFNLKKVPTYVSDATIVDVNRHLKEMGNVNVRHENIVKLSERLVEYQHNHQIVLQSNIFWTSSGFFWEFPNEIYQHLSSTSFTFIKGDANYRRLLGDRYWPTDTKFHEIVSYFPTSFVSLRTLKSDPIIGIDPATHARLTKDDPLWRVNGERGVIQSYFH